jgi:hypothetical protein
MVRTAGRSTHFFNRDERVSLEGHQVLANGHRGEPKTRCEFVYGGAVCALEKGENFGFGGVHARRPSIPSAAAGLQDKALKAVNSVKTGKDLTR